MNRKEIPVLLLTGYLGSGKTTLVNRILSNAEGIRFAVIVNDIGEVNIDAELIQQGGVVDSKDDSLVALQNGCICCTLRTDLIEQITELVRMDKFDYIVIEASGICEPEPIAQTICTIPTLGGKYTENGTCRLDCIVTVVDALRMQDEFSGGNSLTRKDYGEEDIENLIISQIEFCNIILLNKASEVPAKELAVMKQILKTLQPGAEIIECDYAGVDIERLLNTGLFDFDRAAISAGWIRGIESEVSQEEESEARGAHPEHDGHEHEHEHEHGHHHHHHHDEGEAEEYGIGTFVYYRRPAFDINKFDNFIARHWPSAVIRAKGICYFTDNRDMSYMFEQAGRQKQLREAGQWYATAPIEDLIQLMRQDPGFIRDWDEQYGDRMQKIVFIGKDMDVQKIKDDLDNCLEEAGM
ncbi:MAG: GTP-binding protein [Bacteroidetes bacterium]|uniref:GTP-binding protein n=1 Tax=Candidatus Merdivivens pullistercoris TaxID=2840873 RepID=A0A9D9I419_9BACT|nr:GTP-binding protein [Candidatus Merdivivens pullistercoris]